MFEPGEVARRPFAGDRARVGQQRHVEGRVVAFAAGAGEAGHAEPAEFVRCVLVSTGVGFQRSVRGRGWSG